MYQFVCKECKNKHFEVVESNDFNLFIFECTNCLEKHVVVTVEEDPGTVQATIIT